MIFFGCWFYREKKVKGEKGRTRNFKKQFKNKKDYFTHSFQKKKTNKQENRKRKKNGRKRKSRRCLHQFVGWITTFFQIHHNRQAKNAKTGDQFSRHRNIRQNKKNKCKTCPTKKNRQQGFFGEKRKTEKESLTEVYKDSKNCEERLQTEKNEETIQEQEK